MSHVPIIQLAFPKAEHALERGHLSEHYIDQLTPVLKFFIQLVQMTSNVNVKS